MHNIRIGNGFDIHKLVKDRDLIIGGVKIEYPLGLEGHSDADVLVHSIIDSLLGASNNGDIGNLFPDTDKSYKNINSLKLLTEVYNRFFIDKIEIINIDSTIICQKPKLLPYIDDMKKTISHTLGNIGPDRIGIKGKTSEGLGFCGRGEGIASYTVALINFL